MTTVGSSKKSSRRIRKKLVKKIHMISDQITIKAYKDHFNSGKE